MSTATVDDILHAELFPAAVRSWKIETGPDASGADAVWVWVTLDDDTFDWGTRSRVRDSIRQALERRGGVEAPWVYVRFRKASEPVPA